MFYLSTAPPEPAVKNRNVVISLGKEQRINCSVAASPQPDFKWLLNSSHLPESSWTSSYDDVMGISTLTFEFEENHLNSNCEISVACVATNSYGTSEHHFTLAPADELVCSSTKTASSTPSSNPPVITNDPQLDRSKGSDSSDGKMSDTTFKIIIGSITVAATVIVIGIVILLVYFMKHFCRGKK